MQKCLQEHIHEHHPIYSLSEYYASIGIQTLLCCVLHLQTVCKPIINTKVKLHYLLLSLSLQTVCTLPPVQLRHVRFWHVSSPVSVSVSDSAVLASCTKSSEPSSSPMANTFLQQRYDATRSRLLSGRLSTSPQTAAFGTARSHAALLQGVCSLYHHAQVLHNPPPANPPQTFQASTISSSVREFGCFGGPEPDSTAPLCTQPWQSGVTQPIWFSHKCKALCTAQTTQPLKCLLGGLCWHHNHVVKHQGEEERGGPQRLLHLFKVVERVILWGCTRAGVMSMAKVANSASHTHVRVDQNGLVCDLLTLDQTSLIKYEYPKLWQTPYQSYQQHGLCPALSIPSLAWFSNELLSLDTLCRGGHHLHDTTHWRDQ